MPLKRVTQDIGETITINASVLGVTTLADIEMILKIILLVASIVYTVARWRTHCKNNR